MRLGSGVEDVDRPIGGVELAILALLLELFGIAREQFADHRRGGALSQRARPKTQRDKQAKSDRGHGQRNHRASLPGKQPPFGSPVPHRPPESANSIRRSGDTQIPVFWANSGPQSLGIGQRSGWLRHRLGLSTDCAWAGAVG